jgi:hypothetical protein
MKVLTVCGLLAASLVLAAPGADGQKELTAKLKRATAGGRYQTLLRQFKVPGDRDRHGAFKDFGLYESKSYGGFRDLPRGYWVYVAPFWYIWRERTADEAAKRSWGPEQATGAPDTNVAGDYQTAWASKTPDGEDEWLMLEYAAPVLVKEVRVHESYNPGAVVRLTGFGLDGSEVELWRGKDPSAGKDQGTSVLTVKKPMLTNRVKLYLDSKAVTGWNEIDAVGIKDDRGKLHWAAHAAASSTFAPPSQPRNPEQRVRDLEKEARDLREKIKKLEQSLEKSDR